LIEPEHRLVARQLAKEWEAPLTAQRHLQEESERFVQAQPQSLSAAEREAIAQLASNIPALWHATTTTMAERKEIVRQIIQQVVVAGEGTSERLQVTIAWVGGGTTAGLITRPLSRTEHLSYYPLLCGVPGAPTGNRFIVPGLQGPLIGKKEPTRELMPPLPAIDLELHACPEWFVLDIP
jgi:hypothetical protein